MCVCGVCIYRGEYYRDFLNIPLEGWRRIERGQIGIWDAGAPVGEIGSTEEEEGENG